MITANKAVQGVLAEMAEVAGYLWQRGWAERNAGNLSVNITGMLSGRELKDMRPEGIIKLSENYEYLNSEVLLVTATGSRMRDLSKDPASNSCLVAIQKGRSPFYCSLSGEKPGLKPTSEIGTHLAIQQILRKKGEGQKAVLHSHVTEFIALTHNKKFRSASAINRMLRSMHPEVAMFCPKGAGYVPFTEPGSMLMAKKTTKALAAHDVVIWERHGCVATGSTPNEAFDLLDILAKAVKIFYMIG
ncbi:MAG: rhamnulose-1-phosphate aldolase [bacterium]